MRPCNVLCYNAACCNAVLQGIQLAIARQVLPALPAPPKLTRIDVKGKTALEVRMKHNTRSTAERSRQLSALSVSRQRYVARIRCEYKRNTLRAF